MKIRYGWLSLALLTVTPAIFGQLRTVQQRSLKDETLVPGDAVLPQIAAGGSFQMQFFITNHTNMPVNFTLAFYDEQGTSMPVPFQSGGTLSTLAGTISPYGMVSAQTAGASNALQTGYAMLDSHPEDTLGLTAVYTQAVSGRPPFQAAVPLVNQFDTHLFMPFQNSGGLTTTVAIVNANDSGSNVTLIAHGLGGGTLCQLKENFIPGGHQAFILSDQLPCTAGATGNLEIQADGLGVSAIGFLFQDFGAFTTVVPQIRAGY